MATPSRRAQRKGKRMSEEYIAAAKTLAAQARQHRVHLLSGNVAFDWDTEQVEADIYAALTAAYLAGRIKQAEEDAKILREQLADAKRPDQRMTLAIAIRAIERGRNLTNVEQMKNLIDALAESDRDVAARKSGKEGG